MIYIRQTGFLFIHIPKCAGTFVKKNLGRYDEFELSFYHSDKKDKRAHRTLDEISKQDRDLFLLLEKLNTNAIVRDPYQRFVSALRQHCKEEAPLILFSSHMMVHRAKQIIKRIIGGNGAIPRDLVHFTPQSFYTHYQGVQVVKNLWTIENSERLVSLELQKLGGGLAKEQLAISEVANSGSRYFRDYLSNKFRFLGEGFGAVSALAKVMDNLSNRTWERLITRLENSLEFRQFTSNYYADDLVLWKKATMTDR